MRRHYIANVMNDIISNYILIIIHAKDDYVLGHY